MKNCSSRSHSTRTSLTVQTTKYPIGYLICLPTSNALCACMRVHIPRKSLVVVALILESCEVSGSRKQPQIMSILCYATTYLLALTSELYHAVNIYFPFCSAPYVRSYVRCAVAPEQIGRKVTKKNRHPQGKCRKNVKIFSIFHKKRGLAVEYDVYSGVFEVCYPHICPIMRGRSIKRIAA